MIRWRIHHREETTSTNLDARNGRHGDVFTAAFQTAGRGRLDHTWLSPPGTNLMMSAVLSVHDLPPDRFATLPLVVGLAVLRGAAATVPPSVALRLKWPNDVLADGRKLAGILCELHGENVIAGIGINVGQTVFAPEIASRATSLARLSAAAPSVASVRDAVLDELDRLYEVWRTDGFAAVYPAIAAVDFLKGRILSVRQTDDDAAPIRGFCGGIAVDGSLEVDGKRIYAGEAHVEGLNGGKVEG